MSVCGSSGTGLTCISNRYPATPSEDEIGKLVTEIPISVALTEFHFILLYKDRVRAVCQLNDQIVYEEMIPVVCLTRRLEEMKSRRRGLKWLCV